MKFKSNLCLLILVAASSHPSSSLPNWYFQQIVHQDNSNHHVTPIQTPDRDVLPWNPDNSNHHREPNQTPDSDVLPWELDNSHHHVAPIWTPGRDVVYPVYNEDGSRRCSASNPCPLKAGDCHHDVDCAGSLKCGNNNCKLEFSLFSQENKRWDLHDDCCTTNTDNFCNQELLYPKSRRTCCTPSNPCPYGHGECEKDADCAGSLICGDKSCGQFYDNAGPRDDCCVHPFSGYVPVVTVLDSKQPEPMYNEDGSRKCSEDSPCPLEAGDCHYDDDCAGSLKCGKNNCKLEFGTYSPEDKRWDLHDDCCTTNTDNFCNNELLYPKSRRTCCSPSNPCPHGHGECEKDEDCEGHLICGDKNCYRFYDDAGPRDDCCVFPKLMWVGGPYDWHVGRSLSYDNTTVF